MVNKRATVLTLTSVLSFGLLTACFNATEVQDTGGHGGGHEGKSASQEESDHSEHRSGHHGHESGSSGYKAVFTWEEPITAGVETELTIHITDQNGDAVSEFDTNHEKLLHLIVVNQDLSFFNHIHPDYRENGVFTVNTTFPAGGKYKLIADSIPKGTSGATLSEWIQVKGEEGAASELKPDSELIKQVDEKEFTLSLSNTLSNEEVVLTYHIGDLKTKQGIDNLEPYLGAVGHVVILSEDTDQYIHVHPLDERSRGPKAEFAAVFPHSGIYKIWGQFQHQGEVMTVPFVVEIK